MHLNEDYLSDAAKLQAVRGIIWSSNPKCYLVYLAEDELPAEIEARRIGLEHQPVIDDAEDYLDRDK